MSKKTMWKKLFLIEIWKRIYIERVGEPIIYNLVSIFFLFFGNFIKKIDYDLVPRQPYAFGLNESFKSAAKKKIKKILVIEFGVASGTGLFNLAFLANKLSNIYGVDYEVIGFDTGEGMPAPLDYRDHPEKYRTGDFPPLTLPHTKLPLKTKIYYGEIKETINLLKNDLVDNIKIGFVSIDVDYYSSTKACTKVFNFDQFFYLPSVIVYFDDVNNPDHNVFCGELLAIDEFNLANKYRKITKMTQLRNYRIFKNAIWLDQMYFMHVLDSTYRTPENFKNEKIQIINKFSL